MIPAIDIQMESVFMSFINYLFAMIHKTPEYKNICNKVVLSLIFNILEYIIHMYMTFDAIIRNNSIKNFGHKYKKKSFIY